MGNMIAEKVTDLILMKLVGRVGHDAGKNTFIFGVNPDPGVDSGLKYLFNIYFVFIFFLIS